MTTTTPHTDDRRERIEAAIAEYARRHGRKPPIDYAARYRRRRRLRPGPQRVAEIINPLFDQLASVRQPTEGAA